MKIKNNIYKNVNYSILLILRLVEREWKLNNSSNRTVEALTGDYNMMPNPLSRC